MLIRGPILEQIKSGNVTLAFRRWRRPTVRKGGTLKTAIGILAIDSIDEVRESEISDRDARRAGFPGRRALLDQVGPRDRTLYRIGLTYAGEDPRIRLREANDLGDDELDGIGQRLRRLDAASRRGDWTIAILEAIRAHPKLAAVDLAERTGFEKDWLKGNVRKLKNLGLTESHHPGYTLSPRGLRFLEYATGRFGQE